MERKSFADMHCSVAQCLEVVGEWWSMLILRDAFLGVSRFDEFQQRLGISRNILNQRLNRLVESGVFAKVPYSDHPPRHDYRLTDKGRDLWPVLTAMRQWGDKYAAPDGPPLRVLHKACGQVTEALLTCSVCGEQLGRRKVRGRARTGGGGAAARTGGRAGAMTVREAPVAAVRFAEVSALAPAGPGRFEGSVSAEWTIAGKPNGGYMLAMLGRAAAAVSAHPHVIAASAHFLRSPEPGPVAVEATVLRRGRSASQVRASMHQHGEPCVESLVTTALLDAASAPFWEGGVPAGGAVPFEECARMAPRLPDGGRVAMIEHTDVRIEPASAGFLSGRPSGDGELRGWIALPGGEPFDATSLLFAVDSFPPASFDIEYSGWVPTLELTAYVRALPAPGPVRILQRARLIEGRRLDESCFVWDVRGRLVAEGSQLAAIRLG